MTPLYCICDKSIAPHVHCGRCGAICVRDSRYDLCVSYTCPDCAAVAVETTECDAYERAGADNTLCIPDRYVHEHAR